MATASVGFLLLAGASGVAQGKKYKVRIVTEPEGAEIRVDDPAAEPIGTTPYDGTLDAGPYLLILDLEGHIQLIEEIVVKKSRKRQTYSFELEEQAKGTIEIVVGNDDSEGASIKIDGNDVGTVPTDVKVAEGPHELLIEKDGFARFEKWVEVSGGEVSTLEVELESLSAKKSPKAKKKKKPSGPRLAPLIVANAGLELSWRRWDYADPGTVSARPFDANLVPLLRAGADIYPLASNPNPTLRSVGLRLAFALGLPPPAQTTDSTEIDTSWNELEVGAHYRHQLSPTAGLRGDLSYGRVAFGFANPGMFVDEVPDVDYRAVKIAGSGDYNSGKVHATAGLGYLAVLSAGKVADRFRSASASGLTFEAGLWYDVMPKVRAGGGLSYRRYVHTFESMAGDAVEATGGTDIYFGLMAGAAYIY